MHVESSFYHMLVLNKQGYKYIFYKMNFFLNCHLKSLQQENYDSKQQQTNVTQKTISASNITLLPSVCLKIYLVLTIVMIHGGNKQLQTPVSHITFISLLL